MTLETDCSWLRAGDSVGAWSSGVLPSFYCFCHKASLPVPGHLGHSLAKWEVSSGCLMLLTQTSSTASPSGGPRLRLVHLKDRAFPLPTADIETQLHLRDDSPKLKGTLLRIFIGPKKPVPCLALGDPLHLWPSSGSRPECSFLWVFNQGK